MNRLEESHGPESQKKDLLQSGYSGWDAASSVLVWSLPSFSSDVSSAKVFSSSLDSLLASGRVGGISGSDLPTGVSTGSILSKQPLLPALTARCKWLHCCWVRLIPFLGTSTLLEECCHAAWWHYMAAMQWWWYVWEGWGWSRAWAGQAMNPYP